MRQKKRKTAAFLYTIKKEELPIAYVLCILIIFLKDKSSLRFEINNVGLFDIIMLC